jgi:molybdopterin molybdotransferase
MTLLRVDAALARILDGVSATPAETIALDLAAGRVLAGPVVAARDQPPFDASAMDGFAVRATDATAGAELRIIGESSAGRRFGGALGAGEAVRIFTGAPIPAGADAVLVQENASVAGEIVTVAEAAVAGRHIRPAGLDFRDGDMLLAAGRRLGPRELALAAAANAATISVRRRPHVAILSIGDELVHPGVEPGHDQIVGSGGIGLVAMARLAGAEASDLGIISDQIDTTAAIARDAAGRGVDVFVTIGGASVGAYDVVRPALTEAGLDLAFWRVAVRPGRPMLFGRLGAMRVLGLPGNPVSSLVCSLLFLRPLIAALQGMDRIDPREPAVLGADLPASDAREDYLRARLDLRPEGLPVATPLPRQDSSMLRTLAEADCLLIRPAEAPAAPAGMGCHVIRFDRAL